MAIGWAHQVETYKVLDLGARTDTEPYQAWVVGGRAGGQRLGRLRLVMLDRMSAFTITLYVHLARNNMAIEVASPHHATVKMADGST